MFQLIEIGPPQKTILARKLLTKPLRRCYWGLTAQVACVLCRQPIKPDQMFRGDSGIRERAHEKCVLQWTREE